MYLTRGISEAMAQSMVDMAAAKSEGMDSMVQRTALTSSPTTFCQWCEDVLKPATQS
jgi:hypothetical protein